MKGGFVITSSTVQLPDHLRIRQCLNELIVLTFSDTHNIYISSCQGQNGLCIQVESQIIGVYIYLEGGSVHDTVEIC